MKITKMTIWISGMVVALSVALAFANYRIGLGVEESTRAVNADVVEELGQNRALSLAVVAIRRDVLRIQQSLQGISATRGLDGLDDGFEQAQFYADRLSVNVDAARGLAEALEHPELMRISMRWRRMSRPITQPEGQWRRPMWRADPRRATR